MISNEKPKLDAERKWRYMIPIAHQFYIYARKAAEDLLGADDVERFIEHLEGAAPPPISHFDGG